MGRGLRPPENLQIFLNHCILSFGRRRNFSYIYRDVLWAWGLKKFENCTGVRLRVFVVETNPFRDGSILSCVKKSSGMTEREW